MAVEVIYPEVYHNCKAEAFEGGYLFICPLCGYQRKQYLDGRKAEIVCKGDTMAAHFGNAGVCEMNDMAGQLRTALNDAAAKCAMDNDGTKVPVSFG